MGFLVSLILSAAVAVWAGHMLGRRGPAGQAMPMRRVAVVVGAGFAAWYGLGWAARFYAETDMPGWGLAEWWAYTGTWLAFMAGVLFGIGFEAGRESAPPRRNRSWIYGIAVLAAMSGAAWRTFPAYVLIGETRRGPDGRMRQSISYTCGPVSLGNFLERFMARKGLTERELARLCGTTLEGTSRRGLLRGARQLGAEVMALGMMSAEDLTRFGQPAIVTISTLPEVRHATLFLRFEGGDVYLIDPEYGYQIVPRERFLKIWYGKTMVIRGRAAARGPL